MFGKKYYLCMKWINYKLIKTVWHCSSKTASTFLPHQYDFVMPLQRKPKDIEIKEGK